MKDKLVYFAGLQAEILSAEAALKSLVEKYKLETKEYFGIEAGKPIDLIQLANFMLKMTDKPKIDHDEHIFGAPV